MARPPHRVSSSPALASSSAASSVTLVNPAGGTRSEQSTRADQVIYRFYLKTVTILVESRLTHYGGGGAAAPGKGDRKRDKWFNLSVPEVAMHKPDLQIYRSVSSYPSAAAEPNDPTADPCAVPPLLVAFILDTSDLPSGQALMWNRGGRKVTIDTGLLAQAQGKGKGKERSGIVLERWTLRASIPPADQPSSSSMPPHTAYRHLTIHFRALFALLRLLPAYRLFRRLRRANNGLRLGIKLWGPEGYPNSPSGLEEAWQIMERGLVSLSTGLETFVSGEEVEPEEVEAYDLPSLDLFGIQYALSGQFRQEVDFHVEDMESVLSEKLVDMDEDWFTPTVAARRDSQSSVRAEARRIATPTSIPTNSPIPHRQQAAHIGSLGSAAGSLTRPSGSRAVSAAQPKPASLGRWGALAEGMPFAGPGASTPAEGTGKEPPSPGAGASAGGAAVAARRLSAHSIHPFTSASPSQSLLRQTPPLNSQAAAPIPGQFRPSSIGRTSSFLSQSGRSFTHAQLANMYATSASPPVTGAMSGHQSPPPGHSPVSPSSLSFTKQPIPRSLSGRPSYGTPTSSSPFIPGSLDRDATMIPGSAGGPPQIIKRYSSSLSRRTGPLSGGAVQPQNTGASGSSGEGASPGQSLLRRTSTRASQESGLRYSLEGNRPTASAGVDDDEIQAFLKSLDAIPQPPSLAAHAAHHSRSHLPSTSSSLSAPSGSVSASPLQTSGDSPGRPMMTRAQVDDALKRMAGSFNLTSNQLGDSSTNLAAAKQVLTPPSRPASSASSAPQAPGQNVGLLTASRPTSVSRRVPIDQSDASAGASSRPMYRRQTSGGSPLALHTTSFREPSPTPDPVPPTSPKTSPTKENRPAQAARSLPGPSAPMVEDLPLPPRTALLPQPTGSTSTSAMASIRRGPVLLRGGFGEQRQAAGMRGSAGSSPSHSPIRDLARTPSGSLASRGPGGGGGAFGAGPSLSAGAGAGAGAEKQAAVDELGAWRQQRETTAPATWGRYRSSISVSGRGPAAGGMSGGGAGRTTAPSSLGARGAGESGGGEDERNGGKDGEGKRGRTGRVVSEGGGGGAGHAPVSVYPIDGGQQQSEGEGG